MSSKPINIQQSESEPPHMHMPPREFSLILYGIEPPSDLDPSCSSRISSTVNEKHTSAQHSDRNRHQARCAGSAPARGMGDKPGLALVGPSLMVAGRAFIIPCFTFLSLM